MAVGIFLGIVICFGIIEGLYILIRKTPVDTKPIKDAFVCPDTKCGLVVVSNNTTYLKFLAAEHVEYHELSNEDAATFRQINGA